MLISSTSQSIPLDRTDSISPIQVNLGDENGYPIRFESLEAISDLLQEAGLQPGSVLIVTDKNVGALYADGIETSLISRGWVPKRITIPVGESSKSPDVLKNIYDVALSTGIERATPLLALGGGVVGDLAGFAASTLLRGIPFVQLPTTLLAMVDSSIGGKTGINHETGKNLIGTFYQPRFVCTDVRVLDSLPLKEWTNGLSEVVKHALISESPFRAWLTDNFDLVLNREMSVSKKMIQKAAAIKANVVSVDEKEEGVRSFLNFGHTFAHALEAGAGYGVISHGEAVLVGIKAALALSKKYNPSLNTETAFALLDQLPFPDSLDSFDLSELTARMSFDKKNKGGGVRFVLLKELGKPYLYSEIGEAEITAAWENAFQRG